jgi:DNA-binding response OmpR family regulator
VLVIEDDPAIRSSLVRSLTDRGHAVSSAPAAMAGLQRVLDDEPDLVLLDLGLPDLDGHSLLTMLRAVRRTPVIVVTARDDDPSVVRALDAGADDYVVKPFAMDQLEARMRAVLRRAQPGGEEGPLGVGGLVVDPVAREVTLDGAPVELTRREFDLLHLLAQRAGEVVTKREILAEVWNQPYGGGERTVDVHLSWLRRKLGESAAHPVYLHSVRGVGVRLVAPHAPAVSDAPAEDG